MFTSLFNNEDGEEKRKQVCVDKINLFRTNFCSVLLSEHHAELPDIGTCIILKQIQFG